MLIKVDYEDITLSRLCYYLSESTRGTNTNTMFFSTYIHTLHIYTYAYIYIYIYIYINTPTRRQVSVMDHFCFFRLKLSKMMSNPFQPYDYLNLICEIHCIVLHTNVGRFDTDICVCYTLFFNLHFLIMLIFKKYLLKFVYDFHSFAVDIVLSV